MKTVFLIVGESSSGKDSIANKLEQDGYKVLKSFTTRPPRTNETDTHIFISSDKVGDYRDQMIAYTKIGEYEYFATVNQLYDSDIYIIDPYGVEYLKKQINNSRVYDIDDMRLITIYIKVSEFQRRMRAIDIRKDNPETVTKRFMAEKQQFDEFKSKMRFDYCILNENLTTSYKIIKTIIDEEQMG